MNKTIGLTIADPCNQSWHEMPQENNGRFCQKCSKTVIDFSSMPDVAVLKLLGQSSGEVCGRIKASQLTLSIPQPVVYRQPEFSLRALVFGLALTTFSAVNVAAQEITGAKRVEQVVNTKEPNKVIPGAYTIVVQRGDSSRIDSATVIVYFTDGSSVVYVTDSLGVCHFLSEQPVGGVRVMDRQNNSHYFDASEFNNANELLAVVEDYERYIMGKMVIPVPEPAPAKPEKKRK